MQLKTLGIWLGFDYQLPMKREGAGRVIIYLVKHLLKNYPLKIEVWCYSFNLKEVKELFSDLLRDDRYGNRIEIISEKDCAMNKENRWQVFKQAIKLVHWILIYGFAVRWKDPFRIYRTYYPLSFKERREMVGKSVNAGTRLVSLPIDSVAAAILILSGIVSRLVRKTLLRGIEYKEIEMKKYTEIKGSDLASSTGRIEGDSRVGQTGDKDDYLVYGPYLRLPMGFYEIRMDYHVDGQGPGIIGYWDVVFDSGKRVVKSGTIKGSGSGTIREKLLIYGDYKYMPMEVRVKYNGGGRLEVKKLEIYCSDSEGNGIAVKDALAMLANKYSKADCFLISIVTQGNGLEISKPKVVIMHDLVTLEFYDYFIKQDPNMAHWINYGKKCAEEYGKQGTFFCGISNYVIKDQLLKFIKTIPEENTTYIYHASMVPENISEKLLDRNTLLEKYNITKKYIFYPTQIRPYKNVITLLKTIKILQADGSQLQVVLTADTKLKDDNKAYVYANENHLLNDIIFCGSVPESDLYSLYKYAELMVSPSLFEGGFPLQALEALLMNTPVLMARIPVTLERLRHAGFDPENCGLKLFEPENEDELADKVLEALKNREKTLQDQQVVKNKLLSYTWDDVSKQYHKVFSEMLRNLKSG